MLRVFFKKSPELRMQTEFGSGRILSTGDEFMIKKCPFNFDACTPECALFIAPTDLNELVSNRLTSIGVYDRTHGMCSFKNHALAKSREIFDKLQANKF